MCVMPASVQTPYRDIKLQFECSLKSSRRDGDKMSCQSRALLASAHTRHSKTRPSILLHTQRNSCTSRHPLSLSGLAVADEHREDGSFLHRGMSTLQHFTC